VTGRGGEVGAILVAGGGIAGLQAALDATAAGFKVYLVERDISIEGLLPRTPFPFTPKRFAKNEEVKGEN
jgi:heterodisulfide reductase subunit A-like polyferredoxin